MRALSLVVSTALLGCSAEPGGILLGADESDASSDTDAGVLPGRDAGDVADAAPGADGGVEEPRPEPTGCSATESRALCRLENAADWELAERAGVADQGGAIALDPAGLVEGSDEIGDYNGGAFVYGALVSAPLEPGIGFDQAVVSWNAETPGGTWIAIAASCRIGNEWTGWYRLGVWASAQSDLVRHSFDGEADGHGRVLTDTVALNSPADAIRIRATLFSVDGIASPRLRRLAAALSATSAPRAADEGGQAWGTILDVVERSQMVYPDGGEVWCSPTSTSMVMAYWARTEGRQEWELPVPTVAQGTWDEVYGGNGNWPFNVAYASSVGLDGVVAAFASIGEIEPWIAAGVPVVVSAQWGPGELDDAPISSTDGHLLVVTGFEADGDVTVNDPAAASDQEVGRVYDRRQIEAAWLGGSGGIVYLMFPPGRPVPW
ncbi:MAG: peptidase C39 family protein [Deltaproteobacteria bacterium]|nr:peptidase C39 family protein [Deltaproteobacteria bacterium]